MDRGTGHATVSSRKVLLHVNLVVCAIGLSCRYRPESGPSTRNGHPVAKMDSFAPVQIETRRQRRSPAVFSDKIVVRNVGVKCPDQIVSVAPCVGDSEITCTRDSAQRTRSIQWRAHRSLQRVSRFRTALLRRSLLYWRGTLPFPWALGTCDSKIDPANQ